MNKHFPSCSLCISTYNWTSALKLCLNSVLTQTILPSEIIIGDDGSKSDTKSIIDEISKIFPVPIIHIWQVDEGYQLAKIRNKSFNAANSKYLIQIDGDLILHPKFIEHHLTFAKPNSFLAGTRAMLPQAFSATILEQQKTPSISELYRFCQKKYNAISNKLLAYLFYKYQNGIQQTKYVLGANMSFWKADIIKINGYNEDFTGWGKEDNDLAIRLCNAGIKLHFIKFSAIVFHLHHKEADRSNQLKNEKMSNNAISEKIYLAKNGIVKY